MVVSSRHLCIGRQVSGYKSSMSDLDNAPSKQLASADGSALDLLEREDHELLQLFAELAASRGSSVESRAHYGDLAKNLIRHVATREAALVDVSTALEGLEGVERERTAFEDDTSERRQAIDMVERMSRGVQGINLNSGQDFDGALSVLIDILERGIQRDLRDSIPALRRRLTPEQADEQFHSARHVVRHAPTNLSPKGPAWYERAPFISRIVALYDRFARFSGSNSTRPRLDKDCQSQSSHPATSPTRDTTRARR